MKKAVERLREICKDNIEALSLLDEIKSWNDAYFTLDELDIMSQTASEEIHRLSSSLKLNIAMSDVLELARDEFGVEPPLALNLEAIEEVKRIITSFEEKKEKIDKLRTLYTIEQMVQ